MHQWQKFGKNRSTDTGDIAEKYSRACTDKLMHGQSVDRGTQTYSRHLCLLKRLKKVTTYIMLSHYDIIPEHVSGAEQKVLPLRIKSDFLTSTHCSVPAPRPPLTLRPIFLRPAHRSAPPEFWPAPLRFLSAHTCHKLSRKQWPIRRTNGRTCCIVL